MSKIPMMIYRVYLNDSQSILDNLNNLSQPSPSNYLINITDAELNPSSSQDNLLIDITSSNFPTGFAPQEVIDKGEVTKKVEKDESNKFFVTFKIKSIIYYLKKR